MATVFYYSFSDFQWFPVVSQTYKSIFMLSTMFTALSLVVNPGRTSLGSIECRGLNQKAMQWCTAREQQPQTLGFSYAQENAIWRNETCNGSLYPLRDTIHAPPSSTFPSSCRLAVIYRCIFELGAWPVRRPVEAPQFIIRGAWRYLTPAIDPKTRL